MKIEFNTEKNEENKASRGLDFADVVFLDWENALVVKDNRFDYGETRYSALVMGERLYAVAFTYRNNAMRVISFRKANKREERRYNER